MSPHYLRNIVLFSTSAIILSGCAFAGGMTTSEQEMVSDMSPSQFQPATRDVRNNIETQDTFAQAAFWSREYQLNPADLEAAIKLSSAVRKMGNPGKAVEITQTTRALYPTDPYLTAEYAAALIASERSEEAIEAIDGGLRMAPSYGRLWSLKGAALDQMENYELARKHYARALQITPNDANVMSNLGLSYALAGDPVTAEAWLRRALAQPGANPNIEQTLSLVMQLQNKQMAGAPGPQNFASTQRQPVQDQKQVQTQRQAQNQPRTYGQTQPAYSAPQAAPQPVYRSAPSSQPQTQRSAAYTSQTTAAHNSYKSNTQNNPGFGYSSNFSVMGATDNGAPQSAADAARAAAARSQAQGRKVVIPAGADTVSPQQSDILSQIARNVGPRATNLAPQSAPMPTAATPQQTQPYYTPQQPNASYNSAYTQSYTQNEPTRLQPRGAARRR